MADGRTVHRNLPLILTSPVLAAGVFALVLPPLIEDPNPAGFVVVGALGLAAATLLWTGCRVRLVLTSDGADLYGLFTHRRILWSDVTEVRTAQLTPGGQTGVILTVRGEDVMCPVPTYSRDDFPRGYWRRHTRAAYDDARSAWQRNAHARGHGSFPAPDSSGTHASEAADDAAPVGEDDAAGRQTVVGTIAGTAAMAALAYGISGVITGDWDWAGTQAAHYAIGVAGVCVLARLARVVKTRRPRP